MSSRFGAAIGAVAAILALAAPHGHAHEGHDHADKPAPAAASGARAESTSSAFELVAIARGTSLELYLDAFATNAPVTGASIDVETPDGPSAAVAQPDQVYRLDA